MSDAETKAHLSTLFATVNLSDAEVATMTGIIARAGGFEYARAVAERHAERAVGALSAFAPTPFRETLENLARYVTARDR